MVNICFKKAALLFLRYIEDQKLKAVQRISKSKDTICSTGSIFILTIEIIFALIQPYPFLVGTKVFIDQLMYLISVEYELNTLLLIPVLFRSYTVYNFLISLTPFYNVKADRVRYSNK
jgi:hypothetical protein